MLSIAISGGIASGKSMATEYLKSQGYTVVDADEMAREITSAGGKAMPYIRENFGAEYILEDGSLNRAAMRDLVFKNPAKLALLEEGTTKVVIEDIAKIRAQREGEGDKILFYDIPLLFEKHQEGEYDAVWVITADREIRKIRLMERDDIDPDMIELIMDSQEDEDSKVSKADFVIYNNGTLNELYRAIDDALAHYV